MRNIWLPATLVFLLTLGTVSCEQESGLEEAGEEMDEAVDDATDE